jgi:hypothetical protein
VLKALQTISCFIDFSVKLALGPKDAHHLGHLALARLSSVSQSGRHSGSQFPQDSQFWG